MNPVQTTATPKENKESITLIWFDPNIGKREDTQKTQEQLRQINDYVVFYVDLDLCISFIKEHEKENIFLITSGKQASQILPRVIKLRQVDSIFIFCMKTERYQHLTKEYSKIIDIYNSETQLCKSIKEQIDLVDKQLQTFSTFDKHQKSTKNLSKQSGEFIWFQLFKYVILRLPRNEQAKQEMIDTCRNYYRGNKTELKTIEKFEREYRSDDVIRWYTKQSFVYKLVNKAMRIGDIHQLYRFRYFIGDLSQSLAHEHEKLLNSNEETIIVYRGARLDKDEFDKLKENQGNLISTNGYLSTSRDRSLALSYATQSTKPNIVIALFEIKCDIKHLVRSVIFADIAEFSEFDIEQEVLFDLDAAFRLDSIEEDGGVQLIKMTVTNEAEMIIKHYIEETERETGEKSVSIVFGNLMCDLGEYDKALTYFEQLLEKPNGEDLAWIEHYIGRTLYFKGEWDASREYYESAYRRKINAKPSRIKDAASSLNNIGLILCHQGKYNEALDYHKRALEIQEEFYPSKHPNTALNLNNIGGIFYMLGKYNEALDYHQRALQIQEKLYPSGHIDIAHSLNNIGNVFDTQGKHDKALEYYQQALQIKERFYPSGHVDIATSLNNIGATLDNQGKYNEALDYHQRALQMYEKFYPSGHVDIAHSFNNIGNILDNQKKYNEALEYHQRALEMYEKLYSSDHADIATSLNNIGIIYRRQGKYNEALNYYQRALEIRKKIYRSDHIVIADSLRNIGLLYKYRKQKKIALDYYQQALTIYEKFLPSGHPSRIEIENDIYSQGNKRIPILLVFLILFGVSLYFFVLLCTSPYFLVLSDISQYVFIMVTSFLYLLILIYTYRYFPD